MNLEAALLRIHFEASERSSQRDKRSIHRGSLEQNHFFFTETSRSLQSMVIISGYRGGLLKKNKIVTNNVYGRGC